MGALRGIAPQAASRLCLLSCSPAGVISQQAVGMLADDAALTVSKGTETAGLLSVWHCSPTRFQLCINQSGRSPCCLRLLAQGDD